MNDYRLWVWRPEIRPVNNILLIPLNGRIRGSPWCLCLRYQNPSWFRVIIHMKKKTFVKYNKFFSTIVCMQNKYNVENINNEKLTWIALSIN